MSGQFQPISNQANKIGGLRIQSSGYGASIPIVYGTNRCVSNLIDYTNFNATPHNSSQSVGGKGGSSTLTTTTYTYTATVLMAACEGPISGFGKMWLGKNLYPNPANRNLTVFNGSYPQSVWPFLSTLADLQLLEGIINYTVPAVGPYTITPTPPTGTSWAADFGVYKLGVLLQPFGDARVGVFVPYTVAAGVYTFDPLIVLPGTVVTISFYYSNNTVGGRALPYSGIAYAACASYDLGGSATLGNHTFEIIGTGPRQNGYDVNPLDVISDFSTNVNYGANFNYLGSITAAWNYCQANGIYISPVLDAQQPAANWLQKFASIANVGLVWSQGTLKFVPYGDQTITGNGATYTPNITPLYALTDDDFQGTNGDPVKVSRKRQSDAFNAVQVEFLNRANEYNIEIAQVKDQDNIEKFGLRNMPTITLHEVCQASIAKLIAQQVLQRQLYIRNEYTFDLSWKYDLLEPMDIVSLTDSVLGLNNTPVRIISIAESADGLLTMVAEEMPFGVAQPAQYPPTVTGGGSTNFNVVSPAANIPLILSPPFELATNTLEMWLAVSGPIGWGGCYIWASSDGNTYKQVGVQIGNSRIGKLSAALAIGTDPDTTHTAAVDLSSSRGQLYSGTQADADTFRTLCYVGGEYLSYQTATLTSASHYNLTYLRRGAYNSPILAHSSGDTFIRVDDGIFKLPYTADQIGKLIYVKLQSFNPYQGGVLDLANITPSVFYAPSPPLPPNVANLAVQQNGTVVIFSWKQVSDYALKGYDIGYAPQGTTDWARFTMLTEAAKGTEMTNAAVPPGTWVFAIRARDIINQLSAVMATQNLTVTNPNLNIINSVEEIGWNGTLVGLVEHYTGVLVPDSIHLVSDYSGGSYTGWEWSDQWVPDPVSYIEYTSPTLDASYDSALRVYQNDAFTLGIGQTGVPDMQEFIDTWLTAGSDLGVYTPWTIGTLTMRYIKGRISATIAQGSLYMITDYTLTVDMSPIVESPPSNLTVPASNTTVSTFPQPFHYPPFVNPQVISGGTSATASSITKTGCIFHVWTGATETGGVITYTATGE